MQAEVSDHTIGFTLLIRYVHVLFLATDIILCYSVGTRTHTSDQHLPQSWIGWKLLLRITNPYLGLERDRALGGVSRDWRI